MSRFIEWEMEYNPKLYSKPLCDEFIDKRMLVHIIGNIDCPSDVDEKSFKSVMNEVATTLSIIPYFKFEDIQKEKKNGI